MLNSQKTRIFDETGKQLAHIHEMDIRFNKNSTMVEALVESCVLPDNLEGFGEYPYTVKRWWVKEIVSKDDFLEIHLIPQK